VVGRTEVIDTMLVNHSLDYNPEKSFTQVATVGHLIP